MTNKEISKLLGNIAAVYELSGENRFRVVAYQNAAETIAHSDIEVKDLWEQNNLKKLPGIGQAIAGHLDELFKTGKVKHFEEVLKKYPAAMYQLMELPGFGPKKAFKLAKELKLEPGDAVNELYERAKSGKIAVIPGFGQKSQDDIIGAIERFRKGQVREDRMPLPYANVLAEEIIAYLKESSSVLEAVTLGSLRRMVSTIGDIDIAVSTNDPEKVISWFTSYSKKENIIEEGPSGATITLKSGRHIDLRVQTPDAFGAMLQYFTGSKRHNIKLREIALKQGLSLNEYGIKSIKSKSDGKTEIKKYSTEKDFYKAIGLVWIPPEIREDTGEIEAALRQAQGKPQGLPCLIESSDIKGEFHIHTDYNLEPSHDLGRSSFKEILEKASELGYEYIGISDHNPSITNHTETQIISIMKARKAYYEHILTTTKSVRVKLIIMMEIDILTDGKLALPEEAFKYIDAAIVSIHSVFKMDKEKMTQRVLKGLSHPKAKIIGHPTGRLLGQRDGYVLDWQRLFDFCSKNNKAIEINSFPERLDLPDVLVREAIKSGVKLVIDTDSHEAIHMGLIKYGVSVARRGWAEKNDIINTLPFDKVKEWMAKI